jgi:predicted TIM-barrel fold metal-dependent hydrolase
VIVDAHHHVWRRADLPWLDGPMQPRIFGAYEAIRRDYGIEEYLADLAGTAVTRSVYVQANWAPERFLDEVAWVEGLARRTGWPHAIVAYADLLAGDARAALDQLARRPAVRGVRMQLHWHSDPLYRFAARPDIAGDPAFRRNLAHLAGLGLAFELQVFAGQMALAADLAAAVPEAVLVLQHAGMQEDPRPAGLAAWRQGMAALASRPNVVAKLSGLGTFARRLDPRLIAAIVAETLALFGPGRCLWGSNFPIEKLWTGYRPLLDAHLAALGALGPAERRAVLAGTAARVYRLGI